MPCPRCQQPVTVGGPCARCASLDSLFGPVPPAEASAGVYRQPSPPSAPAPDPADPAWLRDATRPGRPPPGNLMVGGATLFLGLGLTLMSYVGVLGRGGGRYTVFLGLIGFGGYRLVRGLIMRD